MEHWRPIARPEGAAHQQERVSRMLPATMPLGRCSGTMGESIMKPGHSAVPSLSPYTHPDGSCLGRHPEEKGQEGVGAYGSGRARGAACQSCRTDELGLITADIPARPKVSRDTCSPNSLAFSRWVKGCPSVSSIRRTCCPLMKSACSWSSLRPCLFGRLNSEAIWASGG